MDLSGGAGRPPATAERERTVRLLTAHFARDHLGLEELERRLDGAYAARSGAELAELVRDLPELEEEAIPARGPAPVPVRRDREARESALVLACMGGAERGGDWTPARTVRALALMGGVELDFREAVFATDEVEVQALALMGGVEIVVSPGVRLDVEGLAVMGGFERRTPDLEPHPDAPLLRVRGLALMGGVEVRVRLPGESKREARRRLKAARRRRRAEGE